jgi:hypothetical protein
MAGTFVGGFELEHLLVGSPGAVLVAQEVFRKLSHQERRLGAFALRPRRGASLGKFEGAQRHRAGGLCVRLIASNHGHLRDQLRQLEIPRRRALSLTDRFFEMRDGLGVLAIQATFACFGHDRPAVDQGLIDGLLFPRRGLLLRQR